jgi:hypothetical protein
MRAKSYLVVFIIFGLLLAASVQWILRGRAPNAELLKGEVSAVGAEAPSQNVRAQAPQKATKAPALFGAKSQSVAKEQVPTAPPLTPTHAYKGIEGLTLRLNHPLLFDVAQVQGLAATSRSFYVSSVDPGQRIAFLYQVRRDTYSVAQVRMLQRETRYRLGGLHLGAELLWAPLAGDEGDDHSLVLGIDPRYLEVKRSFEVAERIAALAEGAGGQLYGINARGDLFYEWAPDGREVRRTPNPSGVAYQDMEVVRGSLVCAGVEPTGGVLDVLDPAGFTILRRHHVDALSPGKNQVTRKGFAFAEGEFYFLPDDGPNPMLMTYVLEGVDLDTFVPHVP